MTVSFQLGDDLEKQPRQDLGDLSQVARDALLIEAYRMGKLSIERLAPTLGIGVVETDQCLAQRRVSLNYSFEDFKADERTLQELRGRSSR